MKRLLLLLCVPLLFLGCGGDDNPADAGGRAIADETFTVPGGTFREFRFTIDTDVQRNAFLQGTAESGDGSFDFAVMTESNFQQWQAGNTPSVIYSPPASPRVSFRLPIEDSDTYYVVYSNIQNTAPRIIKSEIFLFSSVDVGEL